MVVSDAERGAVIIYREGVFYLEFVHPQTGQPVPAGELGEMVITTLTRLGMPLIRYRTGDLSRFIPDLCPCGTILHTLEKVARRWSGYVVSSKIIQAR